MAGTVPRALKLPMELRKLTSAIWSALGNCRAKVLRRISSVLPKLAGLAMKASDKSSILRIPATVCGLAAAHSVFTAMVPAPPRVASMLLGP